jgi:hypothetical protein
MWEAEFGMIMIAGQPRKNMFARPHFNREKLRVAVHICHPSDSRKHKIGRSLFGLT